MQGIILLNYNENVKKIEEEEKNKFLRNLLDQMGIVTDSIWGEDDSLTIDQRIKLRNILANNSIQVIDDLDGHMQVYVEKQLVGEWYKCTYVLKQDLQELDPKKQLYIEMKVRFWTIFEEQ